MKRKEREGKEILMNIEVWPGQTGINATMLS